MYVYKYKYIYVKNFNCNRAWESYVSSEISLSHKCVFTIFVLTLYIYFIFIQKIYVYICLWEVRWCFDSTGEVKFTNQVEDNYGLEFLDLKH